MVAELELPIERASVAALAVEAAQAARLRIGNANMIEISEARRASSRGSWRRTDWRAAGCASPSRPAAARASATCSAGTRRRATTDLIFEGPGGAKSSSIRAAYKLLDGTVLDFDESNMLATSFTLRNPHAKSTCGCGESFYGVECQSSYQVRSPTNWAWN